MPLTLRRSSGFANGSLARNATIACAFAAPIPGSFASSVALAVLMLMRAPAVSLAHAPAIGTRVSPQRSPAATIVLQAFILHLLRWRLCGRRAGALAQATCHDARLVPHRAREALATH